ncbi:MAG: NADH:ubiquinone reductase (Na(+)-transporting) subunit F [Vulcanimicrobiota bacterium]
MFTTFLLGVGVMCGITTILATLILIADATIANYGEVKITINDEKEITAEGGKSLLATLMQNEIFIPSACGGRGSCGLCKVKVEEGAGDYLPTELPWLSPEEKNQNIRLSCQCKVKNDYIIKIPEELFKIKRFKGRIAQLKGLTHDIKEVTIELIEPDSIEFTSGQFIQLQVPEYELSAESVYRAYSVSSPASQKNKVELEIRYVPNGICTTWVHQYLKEGDEVTFNGPYGDFHLRDTDRDIVFIAGGSGMAPIKSILLKMRENNINRKTMYFFGARSLKDLFLVDLMKEFEKDLPNFKFIPALSHPQPEDNWEGEKGLITDVVSKHLESGENVEAYLCGSPGMIDACVKVLTSKGVPEELIYYDKFA